MQKKPILETRAVYAIAIPFNELPLSGFYIPTANTLQQLFGEGEFFHARTQFWKNAQISITCEGIDWWSANVTPDTTQHMLPLLQSDLSKEELRNQLGEYKEKAILL